MNAKVVTRFAPSPTGFLHVGGARTALFNWLYARAKGGKMLLRIEDTDRKRSTPEAIKAIFESLKWLEINWDGETVYQSARQDRHREIAEQMLKDGQAYKCYATPEELEAMREEARTQGRTSAYNGLWRDRDPSQAPEGIDPVVRFRSPESGETVIDDEVQGRVVFQNKDLDDLVLLRSDATPTYMLSVVADDHDMGITHVIRGDDHLTNAGRQAQIYDALGWDRPVFAHVPLLHGPDGAKLSKRHGALGVEAYRDMGYLPDAMRNYLVRLGWSHGDDEIFSTEQAIEWFNLEGIGRSPARFDFAKLENLNGHYIRSSSDENLIANIKTVLPHMAPELSAKMSDEGWLKLSAALPGLKERAKTLNKLIDSAAYLFASRPIEPDEKAKKLLGSEGQDILIGVIPELEGLEDWTTESIEEAIHAYMEKTGLKMGKIAQPLRAALTGITVSPGIFDVLEVLGRNESLARIHDQIS